MRCKRTYVNTCLPLDGGLIKQTTAASDWSVRLQRTDRSQGVGAAVPGLGAGPAGAGGGVPVPGAALRVPPPLLPILLHAELHTQVSQPVYYLYYLHTVSIVYTISTHRVYHLYHIYTRCVRILSTYLLPAPCWPSPWTPTTCPPSSQSTCQHPAPALSTILCFIDYICISDQVFTSYDDSVSVYCRV